MDKWLVIHILSQVFRWCKLVVFLSRSVELYQLISTHALSFQTFLWIKLVILFFTLLSQNIFAPSMQFSSYYVVFHTSQIPEYSQTWQKCTVTALPHVLWPDFVHLLERDEVNSNVWAAESYSAYEGRRCFRCSQGCYSTWGSSSQGAVGEEIKVPMCRAEKNEITLKRICHNFATSSSNVFWSGVFLIVLWVKANFPFKALYI